MLSTDKHRFVELLTVVAEMHNRPLGAAQIDLWWKSLQDRHFEDVARAFAAIIRDASRGQFMPKVADVVWYLDGTNSDRSQAAWIKVQDAIKRVGSYSSVVFDDALIHTCIEQMGGWIQLCGMLTDERPFKAKEFCKLYESYAARGIAPPFSPVLAGIHEVNNRAGGYAIEPPELVGDREKALAVNQSQTATTARTPITSMKALPTAAQAIRASP